MTISAVDELIAYRAEQGKLTPTLKRVRRFHKANPQVLDFLIQELQEVRNSGWTHTSLGSLWHHTRWVLYKNRVPGETFAMSNNLFPWYARLIVIVLPEWNGFFEMNKSKADADFGTALEPEAEPGRKRRLIWADGTPIERGWQPSVKHESKPVRRRERVKRAA